MKNTRISHIEDYLLEISQEFDDVKFKLVELKKNLKVLLKSEKNIICANTRYQGKSYI